MRRLYADFSPGLGWDGREPEAIEAATATQATTRVATLSATGLAALAEIARPLAFLVGGTTPAHAPATVTIAGTADGAATTEVVTLPTNSAGARTAGAVCSRKAWSALTSVTYAAGSGTGGTVAIGFGLVPGVSNLRIIPIETWLEAFPDRRRPGYLDTFQIDEIVRPSSWKIDGALATPNGNYDVPFDLDKLGDIGRITRDFCIAEAAKLKRTVFVTVDYVALHDDAQRDLDKLRKAQASVGTAPPDPAANVGGDVGSIGAEAPYVPPKSFSASLGDFA